MGWVLQVVARLGRRSSLVPIAVTPSTGDWPTEACPVLERGLDRSSSRFCTATTACCLSTTSYMLRGREKWRLTGGMGAFMSVQVAVWPT